MTAKFIRVSREDEEDEMRVRSDFLKGIISSLVTKTLKKKLGKEVKLELGALDVKIGEQAHVHLEIDAEMPREELGRLIREKVKI